MSKKIRTTIYIEKELLDQARNNEINLSLFVNNKLKARFSSSAETTHTHTNSHLTITKKNIIKILQWFIDKSVTLETRFGIGFIEGKAISHIVGSDTRTVQKYKRILFEWGYITEVEHGSYSLTQDALDLLEEVRSQMENKT